MKAGPPNKGLAMEVRPLRDGDLDEVSRLAETVADGDNGYPVEHLLRELRGESETAADPERVAFGAFSGGRLIAVGCGTPWADGVLYVNRVYVEASVRGRGVARRIVGHVEAHFKALGRGVAELHFWGAQVSAQLAWIKLGYRRVGAYGYKHDDHQGYVVTCRKRI